MPANPGTFLTIKITEDRILGYIIVVGQSQKINAAELENYLLNNNIKYGLIKSSFLSILQQIDDAMPDDEILVAKGKNFVPPKEVQITYHFNTKLEAGLMENEKDKIDYRERGIISNVQQGDELATVTPPEVGKPGVGVDGQPIPPPPIPDHHRPVPGYNVDVSKDGFHYTATIDGNARLFLNEIQVSADFEVKRDLNYSTGNIDFIGNVIIKGSVTEGFHVKAGKDIIINKNVEFGASVQAKGDIIIRGAAICGKKGTGIVAEGNLTAHRLENCNIRVNGNMVVSNLLSDCQIFCRGELAINKGQIRGCKITAIGGLQVKDIGTDSGASNTVIEIGYASTAAQALKKTTEEIERIHTEKKLIYKSLQSKSLVSYKDKFKFNTLSQEEQEKVKQMSAAASKQTKLLEAEENKLIDKRSELEEILGYNRFARFTCYGTIYPTCDIIFKDKQEKILDEKKTKLRLGPPEKKKEKEKEKNEPKKVVAKKEK